MLQDAGQGQFDVIVFTKLSRFARNAREYLVTAHKLEQYGVQLASVKENIDPTTQTGKMIAGMLALFAEWELETIRERLIENRVAKGQRGFPTSGRLPFGRTFNKETEKWELDDKAAMQITQAAKEFLAGGSLFKIAEKFQMNYTTLIKTLSERCGDKWTVNFKDEKPITYEIPRILPEEIIEQIRNRLMFNKKNNRVDIRNYVLSGFIRCEHCGHTLQGQTQTVKDIEYQYYRHAMGRDNKCKSFFNVPLASVERAVFETIFENTVDLPSFERAIASSLPDEQMISDLEQKIKVQEKELRQIGKELDQLIDLALSGTLSKETIQKREQTLIQSKANVEEHLIENRGKFNSMPDVEQVRKEAGQIRRQLLEHFRGKDRLQRMTFDEKRNLLHWLFYGKDAKGTNYGIYVNKAGRGKNQKIDYFMYGRITGLRTLKGDDINYQEQDYLTKIVTS